MGGKEGVLCLLSRVLPQPTPHYQLIDEFFLLGNPHLEQDMRVRGTKEVDVAAIRPVTYRCTFA